MTPQHTAQQLLKDYYYAFNTEKDGALLGLLSESVIHDINQGGREIGKAAFREFLQRMRRCYQEQISELVYTTTEDGKRAATEYVVTGKYLQSDEGLPTAHGQTYRLAGGAFFEIDGAGKIGRVTNYYNLQDWLRQVGA
jgi:steroid delta-isomerase-like uncharacterized protein